MTLLKPLSLVLIDAAVEDYQHLASSVRPDYQVVLLNPGQDGIDQITEILATYQDLESLHIVSHGQPGGLLLGSSALTLGNLGTYAEAIQSWGKALTQRASVWLYGCQVAATTAGRSFVQQLQQLTGHDVAASTTLTGAAAGGGNWQLEFATGDLVGSIPFSAEALAAYPYTLTVLLNETFTGNTVTGNWLFGAGTGSANPFLTASTNTTAPTGGLPGSGPTPIDTTGTGTLRLTDNNINQSAYVIYNTAFPSTSGISVEFDFFSYNGSATSTTGGDGISFFLLDGTTPTITPGGFGGSLGYAQRLLETITGIEGGYVGVGLDEFGNFSSRNDSIGAADQRSGPATDNGPVPDSVAVRGRVGATALQGYDFLGGSGTLPSSLDNFTATTRTAASRRARLDITRAGLLSVKVDLNGDGDYLDTGEAPATLTNINIVTTNGGTVPATLKFGFASSTGNATNIHEVRDLTVTTFSTPPTVVNATVGVPPSSVVNVTGLSATDAETSIASYTILTLPSATQGTLYLGNPQSGGTAVTAGQVLTPAQVTQLYFQSQPGFTGGSFTYTATDTDTDVAQPPGTITLTRIEAPITGPTPIPTPNPGDGGDGTGTPIICAPGRNRSTSNKDSKLIGGPNSDRLRGRNGNDVLEGRGCNDVIRGGRGNDTIRGNAANDILLGQQNNDLLNTAGGADEANGGLGRDRINLSDGNDLGRGGRGNDILRGGKGIDQLFGDDSNDQLQGNEGNDNLQGGRNDDKLDGGEGNDVLNGGLQRDNLSGRSGIDTIYGRRGNDRLKGGSQADFIDAGLSNDRIVGGGGADTLLGGGGRDQFVYRNAKHGNDIIRGFERLDQIDISGIFAKDGYTRTPRFDRYVRLTQVGSDTVVRIDSNANAAGGFVPLATLVGVRATSLSADRNFLI